ncbi:MAG TPA: nickel-dependent hydrogenase large subunit, partial [Anaerolineales bacterium]|nr:nickel-dependent hydrogenase large subunit [Anaerolineales bacterium]
PEIALKAVNLRRFGQEIIRILGGRRIHPNFAVAGGVNKALLPAERDTILKGTDAALEAAQIGLGIMKDWAQRNAEDINKFAVLKSGYMSMVNTDDSLNLYDGDLRLVDQTGKLLEKFPGDKYLDYIAEHVENWSYLKFPYYKKMSFPEGVYRVGPLGRMNAVKNISTPIANEEHKLFMAINGGKPVEQTLYFHYARLIEIVFCVERVREMLDDPDILSTDILNTRKDYKGEGIGVLEAPRGTLIHHYKADETGKLTGVNLIVATGHNNWAMSTAVDSVAKTYINGGEVKEGMLNRVEAAVRAHDPCLSCSTHAVGQMPIQIEMLNTEGEIIKTITRD